jgi:hypothetical protein
MITLQDKIQKFEDEYLIIRIRNRMSEHFLILDKIRSIFDNMFLKLYLYANKLLESIKIYLSF